MSARASGRPRSLWLGLALSAATIVLCLLAGEVVTRVWDPGASLWRWPSYAAEASRPSPWEARFAYDPTLGWTAIPGSSGTLLGKPLSFTKEGMREQNRDRPPAPGPSMGPLIIAFGDSMTEGYGVGNDETWPAHLERLTGRRVLNAGVPGYGLDQMVLRAERLVPELKPSTVILAFIADDITRTALAVREAKGKPYFAPDGEGLALRNVPVEGTGPSSLTAMARRLLAYSHLVDWIVNRLGVAQSWYGREVGTGVDPFIVSCRLMDRFAALVKREGASALVVALPEQGVFFDAKAAAGQHEALTQVLGCATKAGLLTLDTLAAFEKEDVGRDIDSYYAMMHFTDRGNAIAARAIAAALACVRVGC
ncbi:GDSL-like Lipase/Acylhydrolase family [Rhodospirillales bacterium URHD0017]|nr:GDSL-like Lipase/Acylhydrolase family [Rhodospirillales bacterium URHD0017]